MRKQTSQNEEKSAFSLWNYSTWLDFWVRIRSWTRKAVVPFFVTKYFEVLWRIKSSSRAFLQSTRKRSISTWSFSKIMISENIGFSLLWTIKSWLEVNGFSSTSSWSLFLNAWVKMLLFRATRDFFSFWKFCCSHRFFHGDIKPENTTRATLRCLIERLLQWHQRLLRCWRRCSLLLWGMNLLSVVHWRWAFSINFLVRRIWTC